MATAQALELEARRKAAAEEDDAPVRRTLLRGTLRAYTRELGLSTEDVLVLEYAPAVAPPTPGPSRAAPDWIGALAATEGFVLAGLYDGTLSLTPAASLLAAGDVSTAIGAPSPAHAGNVCAVAAVERARGGWAGVSAGADGVVAVWRCGAAGKGGPRLARAGTLANEGRVLGGVAVDPTGETVAGGDAEGGLIFWSLPAASAEAAAPEGGAGESAGGKRKRPAAGEAAVSAATASSLRLPAAHAVGTVVSSLAWLGSGTLASGGWDHTIVVTDVEAGGTALLTLRPGKVVTALTASAQGGAVASGHPDGCVRVWDPRGRGSGAGGDGDVIALSGLRASLTVPPVAGGQAGSSTTWVSSLSWAPSSAHYVAGTSYTGSVCLWDIRAPGAPLHAGQGMHEGRALASAWLGGKAGGGSLRILSGGADKRLRSLEVVFPELAIA